MLKIGITGGIGSGKTTVSTIFETLGVPVYYADTEARKLMNTHLGIIEAVQQLLGPESYMNGELNRKFVAEKLFSESAVRGALNKIVHPFTIADSESWMKKQTTPYVLKEAALLFESEANRFLDYVIGVSCPESTRINRVMQRDQTDRHSVLARIKGQMDQAEKLSRCNFIIKNNEKDFLTTQVLQLHEKLLGLARL